MSDYERALAWVYGLQNRGVKLGLERMQAALASRGDPQRACPFVHIAGSNGKGSVAAMVERIARAAGYHTGQFASPHLSRYVERVLIDGAPLDEDEATRRLCGQRADASLDDLTFFEHTTLLAFEAFRDHGCDLVALEAGLGGRLDATNVVTPEVSVVTSISLEHQHILGDTTAAIAGEKAGILKPGVPAVIAARDAPAREVLKARAQALGAPVWLIGEDFDASRRADGLVDIAVPEESFDGLRLGLAGAYQADNAAAAVAAVQRLRSRGYRLDDDAVRTGLAEVRWPGRLEWVDGAPAFLFDAAHNADGCATLAAHLRSLAFSGPVVLLFGAMSDKDHARMLASFDGLVDARVYAIPPIPRAAARSASRASRSARRDRSGS